MDLRSGRSTRWWIGVGVFAVSAGLVGSFVAMRIRDEERPPGSSISVGVVRPGTPGRPAALWLLGQASLRFDPVTLQSGQLLRRQGFGAVLGAAGRVDLFEPGSGRVGSLDARRNELVDLGTVPIGAGAEVDGDPVIADTGDAMWLVTGALTVTRLGLPDRRSTAIPLPAPAGSGATSGTRIVASSRAVYAVTSRAAGSGAFASRIDPATRSVTATEPLPASIGDTPLEVRSLSADTTGVWVLGRRAAVRIDPVTLQVRAAVVYEERALSLYEAAAVHGEIWGLDQASSLLVRIDANGHVRGRYPTRPGRGTLPLPAGLVADDASVWVLAPVGPRTTFGAERLTRVGVASGRITGRFESPANLSVGAIAVSHAP